MSFYYIKNGKIIMSYIKYKGEVYLGDRILELPNKVLYKKMKHINKNFSKEIIKKVIVRLL